LTSTGYQAIFFGLFTKIHQGKTAPRILTLERGASVGALMFMAGAVYVGYLVLGWVNGWFDGLPPVQLDVAGFTLIVLGIQTFFSSFMLSIIATRGKGRESRLVED